MRRAVPLAAILCLLATGASAAACIAPARVSMAAATRPPQIADCSARPPAPGQAFSGAVLQVIDGHTLCVALGPTPDLWVRVRIADASPQSTRQALMVAVFAKSVTCTLTDSSASDPEARCTQSSAQLDPVAP
jgi:hypothetical protein